MATEDNSPGESTNEEVGAVKAEAADVAAPLGTGASATGAVVAVLEEVNTRIGRRRWMICALLFFAATINYIDRQVIGILKPTLQAEIGWTEIEYSWIVFSFQTAYAIGLLFVGSLMDKIGTRVGSALSITVWSIAAMAHAWAVPIFAIAASAYLVALLIIHLFAPKLEPAKINYEQI